MEVDNGPLKNMFLYQEGVVHFHESCFVSTCCAGFHRLFFGPDDGRKYVLLLIEHLRVVHCIPTPSALGSGPSPVCRGHIFFLCLFSSIKSTSIFHGYWELVSGRVITWVGAGRFDFCFAFCFLTDRNSMGELRIRDKWNTNKLIQSDRPCTLRL